MPEFASDLLPVDMDGVLHSMEFMHRRAIHRQLLDALLASLAVHRHAKTLLPALVYPSGSWYRFGSRRVSKPYPNSLPDLVEMRSQDIAATHIGRFSLISIRTMTDSMSAPGSPMGKCLWRTLAHSQKLHTGLQYAVERVLGLVDEIFQ